MKTIKTLFFIVFIVFIAFISVPTLEAAINASPSSLSVPRNMQSVKSMTYRISTPSTAGYTLAVSPAGYFLSGGVPLGTVSTPLSTPLTNGSGVVAETLVVPVRILRMADELKISHFDYQRTFNYAGPFGAPGTESILMQVAVTGEATADFTITRLQLYFENRRAEITVKRNQPGLKAFVDIQYMGSGLLEGYWEVDGRRMDDVSKHFVYGRGRQETIEFPIFPRPPEVQYLPTIDTGTHVVRFVITSPVLSITPPEAIYFVTAEESIKRPIRLISPKNKSNLDYAPISFKWEGKEESITYLIEFLEEVDQKPIFSAYTKKSSYLLPQAVLKSVFAPGHRYYWRVKGFDSDNKVVGESPEFQFFFKQRSSFVPGQILFAVEGGRKGDEQIKQIEQTYHLDLLEIHDLESLQMKLAVFQTQEDIFKILSAIQKKKDVLLTQPNYIFRTMAEPTSERQNIYRVLNLKRLHESVRGKGVKVAVIDTGVDSQHRDLKGRILFSENLLKEFPDKAEVHGTAVAAVIGGKMNGFGMEGVAPEAEILVLRACRQVQDQDPEAECYSASIAKAIDHAIQKKVKVVNMSFGSIDSDPLILKLIEEGSKQGILFVAPVGNLPGQKDLPFPASHPLVVSVAGMDEKGNPYPNSQIASKARVQAPSTNILTAIPGNKYNFLNGTSLSSAAITGLLALASSKTEGLDIQHLPPFNGNLCQWEEDLLKLSLCKKQ